MKYKKIYMHLGSSVVWMNIPCFSAGGYFPPYSPFWVIRLLQVYNATYARIASDRKSEKWLLCESFLTWSCQVTTWRPAFKEENTWQTRKCFSAIKSIWFFSPLDVTTRGLLYSTDKKISMLKIPIWCQWKQEPRRKIYFSGAQKKVGTRDYIL